MEANVVVMGTDSVGKSALTVRLLTRRFIGEYGDIESIYTHIFLIEGREITVNIWDAPYSENSCMDTPLFDRKLQWADAFILVYSICDRASFNAVSRLVHIIKSYKDPLNLDRAPIVIVGNKSDLHHRRTVQTEEGRLLALSCHCLFREVSTAENYHSVFTVFCELMNRMKEHKPVVRRSTVIKGIVKSVSAVFSRRRTDSVESS